MRGLDGDVKLRFQLRRETYQNNNGRGAGEGKGKKTEKNEAGVGGRESRRKVGAEHAGGTAQGGGRREDTRTEEEKRNGEEGNGRRTKKETEANKQTREPAARGSRRRCCVERESVFCFGGIRLFICNYLRFQFSNRFHY